MLIEDRSRNILLQSSNNPHPPLCTYTAATQGQAPHRPKHTMTRPQRPHNATPPPHICSHQAASAHFQARRRCEPQFWPGLHAIQSRPRKRWNPGFSDAPGLLPQALVKPWIFLLRDTAFRSTVNDLCHDWYCRKILLNWRQTDKYRSGARVTFYIYTLVYRNTRSEFLEDSNSVRLRIALAD